jgi:hypothetical protein
VGCVLAALAVPAGALSGRAMSSAPGAVRVGGSCSKATAQSLSADQVIEVLCGAFAGPGSQAMAVMYTNGTCLPFLGWDVYVLKGGSWTKLQLTGHGGLTGKPLVAVGSDLKETIMVPKPGQPVCLATATKSRVWHWNGSTLVAGAWTGTGSSVSKPGTASSVRVYLITPSKKVACDIEDNANAVFAGCQTMNPPSRASVSASGQVSICRNKASCPGDIAEGAHFKVLPYGHSITLGRWRCAAGALDGGGIMCTNTRTGKGFAINGLAMISRVG